MRKLYLFLFFLLGLSVVSSSQSYHFSQFYSTPLLINPAFTGYAGGPYRVAATFRSQWVGGGSPYLTSAVSGDISPFRNVIGEGARFGVGISLMNDQSLEGALQSNVLGLSAAYNLALDPDAVHHMGLGVQGTFSERRLDPTKLTFESQLDQSGFNAALPIGEGIDWRKQRYFDVGTGLLYNYAVEGSSFFLSAAGFNLLQQNENVTLQYFKKPLRLAFQAGGQNDAGYSGRVYYSISHMRQAGITATTIGAAYGILIGEGEHHELDLGVWHRLKDAVIPYIGYQRSGLSFGLSYDYTISDIRLGKQVRNGFELSFTYLGKDKSELKRLVPWY